MNKEETYTRYIDYCISKKITPMTRKNYYKKLQREYERFRYMIKVFYKDSYFGDEDRLIYNNYYKEVRG